MSPILWLRQKLLEEFGLRAADTAALSESVEKVCRRRGVSEGELCRIAAHDSSIRLEIAAGMSVGESYFFRHSEHEDAIRTHVETALSRGRRIRIWSAGCSRGEEPYSVGMILVDRFGGGIRAAVDIDATDIEETALAYGQAGIFGPWSLRGVDPAMQSRHFERTAGGFQVSDELRRWIRFHHSSVQAHLLDVPAGSIDIILFRNVGIYLTAETLAAIHEGFARVLGPDGLLLQAATDPSPPQSCRLRRWSEGPFGSYRVQPRRAESIPAERPARRKSTRAAFGAKSGSWPRDAKTSGERPVHREDDAPAQRSSAAVPSISAASALADAGRVHEAMSLVTQVIARHPRQRSAYVLRAQLRLHQHDCSGAVEDLRRALFLDPSDCLARYWYSVALGEAGRLADADAQRRVLISHLSGRHGGDRLSDGETTVDDLRALMPDSAKELA